MNYQEAMKLLSECGLGALLMDEESTILSVNEAGSRLLCGREGLEGKRLRDLAAPLCEEPGENQYASPVFAEYLLRCPTPEVEGLP